jgi:hypothetical protein
MDQNFCEASSKCNMYAGRLTAFAAFELSLFGATEVLWFAFREQN